MPTIHNENNEGKMNMDREGKGNGVEGPQVDFRGARGSNTGDSFHELWAARHAVRLLRSEGGLESIVVEGLAASDEAIGPPESWDGVDCTLYFGGRNAKHATRIVLEQLKYSAANPQRKWTVNRLVSCAASGKSVLDKLATAWKELAKQCKSGVAPEITLVSNQPIDPEVLEAFRNLAKSPRRRPRSRPQKGDDPKAKIAYAAKLSKADLGKFADSTSFECGAGSRFALEERVIAEVLSWTDSSVMHTVLGLKEFVRKRMLPESSGESITRESVMIHFGVSEWEAVFPCPPHINRVDSPIQRPIVDQAMQLLGGGVQFIAIHGAGGLGKTVALQQIERRLPAGSTMVTFDCYGAGRYMDPSAFRHRSIDAFVQLSNEISAKLRLPLVLTRNLGADYPRLFANRLKHAAQVQYGSDPKSLIVIAIDAADNSVHAAKGRIPEEASFVHEFIRIGDLPKNVCFVVTARTGRLEGLRLPANYSRLQLSPFTREETGENVRREWDAPESWVEDFHRLSGGIPRVQAYAFDTVGPNCTDALNPLRPSGKSLNEVFDHLFRESVAKSGDQLEVRRLCAGLVALARPVPLSALAGTLGCARDQLRDVCIDLSPGIRLNDDKASFADEDFEHFVRQEAEPLLAEVQGSAAAWLLSSAAENQYSAQNVAPALVAAGRGEDLLNLVEQEPVPSAIRDSLLRREAEVQRLKLAISVCRQAGDDQRALRFVIVGAEGLKNEAALRELLLEHPDMAAAFAGETASRLLFGADSRIDNQGAFLFEKLSVDARVGDAFSVREGRRLLDAWLEARWHEAHDNDGRRTKRPWEISASAIESAVYASLLLGETDEAIAMVDSLDSMDIVLQVGGRLPSRLIAEGRHECVEAVVQSGKLGPFAKAFLMIPLALAGRQVCTEKLQQGLSKIVRYASRWRRYFAGYSLSSQQGGVLDASLTLGEMLTSKGGGDTAVDELLDGILQDECRLVGRRSSIESEKLDLLFRAYALREVRAGRKPSGNAVFSSAPEGGSGDHGGRASDGEDSQLRAQARAFLGVYAVVAEALVSKTPQQELWESLTRAVESLERDEQGNPHSYHWRMMRPITARSILVLLAAGYDDTQLMGIAIRLHGGWSSSECSIDARFVSRLSVRHGLHGELIEGLARLANETVRLRIGAAEKAGLLVTCARHLKPISHDDAEAVFRYAVDAIASLGREARAQVSLVERLIVRGLDKVADRIQAARDLSEFVNDAAVRLDGDGEFPWDDAFGALTLLCPEMALMNAARWSEDSLVGLRDSLSVFVSRAMQMGAVRTSQASALAVFVEGKDGMTREAVDLAVAAGTPDLAFLVEELARGAVLVGDEEGGGELVAIASHHGLSSMWVDRLKRQVSFCAALPIVSSEREERGDEVLLERSAALEEFVWEADMLLETEGLRRAIDSLQRREVAASGYLHLEAILECARSKVAPKDRLRFLEALAHLDDVGVSNEVVKALVSCGTEWRSLPSVRAWCRSEIPGVVEERFTEFVCYVSIGMEDLFPALDLAGVSGKNAIGLLLRCLERHVDVLGSDQVYALVRLVAVHLRDDEAGVLVDWFVSRLCEGLPREGHGCVGAGVDFPNNVDDAIGRWIFAYMGDYDVRMRWRAAHSALRLARMGDRLTLSALVDQYDRQEDSAIRGPDTAYYWSASRLWFVLTWDRVVRETSTIGDLVGPLLFEVATGDTFPHVLVREFAKSACHQLVDDGVLELSSGEIARLDRVNQSPFHRRPVSEAVNRAIPRSWRGKRFDFDAMDTIPYWYRPIVECFSGLGGDEFLEAVEGWIVDGLGWDQERIEAVESGRKRSVLERDWPLATNRHGSKPTLERLRTHLEWHAMWCAVGELIGREPLVVIDDPLCYESLDHQVELEMLTEPPLWSSDLLVGRPLVLRDWRPSVDDLSRWLASVPEPYQRSELFPDDRPDYLVVAGDAERRGSERVEVVRIASALVRSSTAASLVRALQTMDDSWDYKLPEEGEHFELNSGEFELAGWLRTPYRDAAIDKDDPFRGRASSISAMPGARVADSCGLSFCRNPVPQWSCEGSREPMFIYEEWGHDETDAERYRADFAVSGCRLLAHRELVLDFLVREGMDLIAEVEVTRRERETRGFSREGRGDNGRAKFDRLYRIDNGGSLGVAEGRVGSWACDSPTA